MGAKEEAVALKDEGNKAIANREWGKAVELYTKAIGLDPSQCVFYSNRAQVGYLLFSIFCRYIHPSIHTRITLTGICFFGFGFSVATPSFY